LVVLSLLLLSSCSSDVERTYKFPDVSTGFVVSQDRTSVLMGIELWDKWSVAGDLILAEDLAAIGISWRATSMFEIKLGAFYGWDFEQHKEAVGGAVLITEF
jgi:hypothetical protein